MPGKVKVKISSGKNLPVMDRSSDTTDAYVEIKLGSTTYKTDVCRKSLHPQWNTDWYRFEVDDSELQDEPLQIRLMDHDTYSANDAIGKVYLNLNPLLLPVDGQLVKYGFNGDSTTHHEISGWIPVYDTMHGIRGEVNVTVKVELFSDFNRFRQSSCGVQFFYSPTVPQGYYAKVIHGFVEELLVNDDPEYQWIDKIRTPRASNEARQTLFFKLSGELQRKIGVKALNLGGNAVIGYRQNYDLEGESGIVARGIGTAVTLVKSINVALPPSAMDDMKEERVQNYLKFLGGDKSFRLSATRNLLIPVPLTFRPYPVLPDPNYSRYKQLSKRLYTSLDLGNLETAYSNPGLNEEIPHISVKTLLKQEDERGIPSGGLSHRLKNLKYSQNSLSKRMTVLKSKMGDSIGEELDEDVSVDNRKKDFKKPSSESSIMAELLARSVIRAHNSLSCILEVQNPTRNEDDNNDGGTLEMLEPIANLLSKTASEPAISSDDNGSERCLSSCDSSSSGSDYDYDDEALEYTNSNIDLETISNIVKDVEMIQKKKVPLQKQVSMPALGPNRIDSVDTLSNNVFNFSEVTNKNFTLPYVCSEVDLLSENDCNENSTNMQDIFFEQEKTYSAGGMNIVPEEVSGISEAIRSVEIKDTGLVKTAIQTLLLEKVSLIGSCTPATSPIFKSDTDYVQIYDKPHEGTAKLINKPKSKIPKSASSLSFSDYVKNNNDTVLGAPFASALALNSEHFKRQKSQPCVFDNVKLRSASFKSLGIETSKLERQNCFSDTQLHKPLIKIMLNESLKKKHNNEEHKFKLFQLKEKKGSHESSLSERKKLFGFLHCIRKSSQGESKEHKNIISRIFHSKSEKDGLTLRKCNIEETSESKNSCLDESSWTTTPSSNVLTNTNRTPRNFPNDLPDNMKIDEGSNCSKIKHACITPNRHNTSAQADQNAAQIGQSPEHHKADQSPARPSGVPCIHRRSSDSDLSITPKGNSLTGSDRSGGIPSGYFMRNNVVLRSQVHQENFDMLEYPFLTMTKFPPGFVAQIGGAVSARSVKRLEIISNVDEPESRDTWWSELRMEIRSHARSLNCNAVLGYSESSSLCDDICVLSACGTAAIIDFQCSEDIDESRQNIVKDSMNVSVERDRINMSSCNKVFESPEHTMNNQINSNCTITHLPYDSNNVPIKTTATKCAICHKGKVPEVLIATIEPPEAIPCTGKGCFIDSYICRPLKDIRGESIAKEISDGLPFLEYELHRLLINKLKIKGMNAIFGLKFRMSIGERIIMGIATGTAVYLNPLPSPILPKLVSDKVSGDKKLANIQKRLNDTVKKNKEIYQIKDEAQNGHVLSEDESEDESTSVDLSVGNKDCCILEVDDPEDEEVLRLLMEERPPDGFHVVNTEIVPGLDDLEIIKNLQMFTQIYRVKFHQPYNISNHFHRLLQTVYFKLRRMVPCALCDLQFRIDLPEPDEVQLCVFGMALGLGKTQKKAKVIVATKRNDEDLIFKLDEDQIPENSIISTNQNRILKYKQKSPSKYRPQSVKQRHIAHRERHGVDITPLSYVPGGVIERYLGNLNFFFIRETTSIREEGGLSGFIHSFVTEVLAIVRAHVTALGGNAMIAFFLTEIVLLHNLHKNQGQCLVNVGGDVVLVSYFKEDT
ncbi:C2 domain-containing protein 5 isoform X2 [Anoplophora glabripennis]|uniref:C2 domain-containing protein 5 isoform X2 n=1 Tax=Anoplophora glabripennis TaxID=217634 RepID=UPI000875A86B|nr:C2 domain-containing protein 5 isoform X2 [Anoplophora glabripennis]